MAWHSWTAFVRFRLARLSANFQVETPLPQLPDPKRARPQLAFAKPATPAQPVNPSHAAAVDSLPVFNVEALEALHERNCINSAKFKPPRLELSPSCPTSFFIRHQDQSTMADQSNTSNPAKRSQRGRKGRSGAPAGGGEKLSNHHDFRFGTCHCTCAVSSSAGTSTASHKQTTTKSQQTSAVTAPQRKASASASVDIPRDMFDWAMSQDGRAFADAIRTKSDVVSVQCVLLRQGRAQFVVGADNRQSLASGCALLEFKLGLEQRLQEARRLKHTLTSEMQSVEEDLRDGRRVEFEVPADALGLIIGKGGANLTRVEEMTGVERIVIDKDTLCVRIKGAPSAVAKARAELEFVVDRIPIQPSQAAYVVGQGGATITDIRTRSRVAQIDVLPKGSPLPRMGSDARPDRSRAGPLEIIILGRRSAVATARMLYEAHLEAVTTASELQAQVAELGQQLQDMDIAYGDAVPASARRRRGGGAGGDRSSGSRPAAAAASGAPNKKGQGRGSQQQQQQKPKGAAASGGQSGGKQQQQQQQQKPKGAATSGGQTGGKQQQQQQQQQQKPKGAAASGGQSGGKQQQQQQQQQQKPKGAAASGGQSGGKQQQQQQQQQKPKGAAASGGQSGGKQQQQQQQQKPKGAAVGPAVSSPPAASQGGQRTRKSRGGGTASKAAASK